MGDPGGAAGPVGSAGSPSPGGGSGPSAHELAKPYSPPPLGPDNPAYNLFEDPSVEELG